VNKTGERWESISEGYMEVWTQPTNYLEDKGHLYSFQDLWWEVERK
jgi:hypothetical protein